MKEYFPADFANVKKYVDEGRWFPQDLRWRRVT